MIKPPRLWTFSTVKNVSLKFNVSTIITLEKCLLLPNSLCVETVERVNDVCTIDK